MRNRIAITSGLALFAMFFGAGNIIYPLELGAHAGDHFPYVISAFLISGIGLPLLGLFATGLYHGNYWEFFNRLGKFPAFLLITFLVLFIGPLFATPRTETVTYHTLQPFLPGVFSNPFVFSGMYCLLIFALTYRDNRVVDVIGRFLSPIKLSLFFILIIAGLIGSHEILTSKQSISSSFKMGLLDGYSTMDLLATFFFCTVVCKNIMAKTQLQGITCNREITKIFLWSCLIGGCLLSIVYIGFMLVALYHAADLQGVDTAQMIVTIANLVLGKFGSLFVGVCVAFACIVTAIALTDVTTDFLYEKMFRQKISRLFCLIITIATTYAMSIIGFTGIMKIALPILEVLYPGLIVFCIINIVFKIFAMKKNDNLIIPKDAAKAIVK